MNLVSQAQQSEKIAGVRKALRAHRSSAGHAANTVGVVIGTMHGTDLARRGIVHPRFGSGSVIALVLMPGSAGFQIGSRIGHAAERVKQRRRRR